ncbi:hypothetical protein QBC38DRAFT_325995, partial [Podospora fimiseda]
LAGSLPAILSPTWFTSQQLLVPPPITLTLTPDTFPPSSLLTTTQLGNPYFLLFCLSLTILQTTSENHVVKAYLRALWIADLSHVAFTCIALGLDKTLDNYCKLER